MNEKYRGTFRPLIKYMYSNRTLLKDLPRRIVLYILSAGSMSSISIISTVSTLSTMSSVTHREYISHIDFILRKILLRSTRHSLLHQDLNSCDLLLLPQLLDTPLHENQLTLDLGLALLTIVVLVYLGSPQRSNISIILNSLRCDVIVRRLIVSPLCSRRIMT